MKLFEYEGSNLFKREGIPVPEFELAASPDEAVAKAKIIGLPVMVKAQVLTGGRWLAGGVHPATTLEEVARVSGDILKASIRGHAVKQVMITPKIDSVKEYYIGVTIDDFHGTPIVILSAEGGVSINEIASSRPEAVVTRSVSITEGLLPSTAKQMCHDVGLNGKELNQVAAVMVSLYSVFSKYDALVAEINPLVMTTQGNLMALDAKVEIDDSSLFRHADLNLSPENRISNQLELKGKQIGVTYVELDGDIAVIASGAGLGMASIDIIGKQLKPANFLETGGGINAELLYKVMDLVLQKKGIRALFINVYGGINPIHEGAKGVVKYMQEHNVKIPIVSKALGNHQEETWEIFRAAGVTVVTDVSTEKAIEKLVEILQSRTGLVAD
jgi:succinyl-CoA synthetase beta subunit